MKINFFRTAIVAVTLTLLSAAFAAEKTKKLDPIEEYKTLQAALVMNESEYAKAEKEENEVKRKNLLVDIAAIKVKMVSLEKKNKILQQAKKADLESKGETQEFNSHTRSSNLTAKADCRDENSDFDKEVCEARLAIVRTESAKVADKERYKNSDRVGKEAIRRVKHQHKVAHSMEKKENTANYYAGLVCKNPADKELVEIRAGAAENLLGSIDRAVYNVVNQGAVAVDIRKTSGRIEHVKGDEEYGIVVKNLRPGCSMTLSQRYDSNYGRNVVKFTATATEGLGMKVQPSQVITLQACSSGYCNPQAPVDWNIDFGR
jgi:hypothetical protein